jgi:hypothetical protein
VTSGGDDLQLKNRESCKIEINNYQELLFGQEESNKELILPNNAEESWLISTIDGRAGNQMPPPEEGYSPLSSEEVKAIREWIEAGALNN